jgi:hypothetical protein
MPSKDAARIRPAYKQPANIHPAGLCVGSVHSASNVGTDLWSTMNGGGSVSSSTRHSTRRRQIALHGDDEDDDIDEMDDEVDDGDWDQYNDDYNLESKGTVCGTGGEHCDAKLEEQLDGDYTSADDIPNPLAELDWSDDYEPTVAVGELIKKDNFNCNRNNLHICKFNGISDCHQPCPSIALANHIEQSCDNVAQLDTLNTVSSSLGKSGVVPLRDIRKEQPNSVGASSELFEYPSQLDASAVCVDGSYNCEYCSLSKLSKSEYRRHVRCCHLPACSICNHWISSEEMGLKHMSKAHGIMLSDGRSLQYYVRRTVACDICAVPFSCQEYARYHAKKKHGIDLTTSRGTRDVRMPVICNRLAPHENLTVTRSTSELLAYPSATTVVSTASKCDLYKGKGECATYEFAGGQRYYSYGRSGNEQHGDHNTSSDGLRSSNLTYSRQPSWYPTTNVMLKAGVQYGYPALPLYDQHSVGYSYSRSYMSNGHAECPNPYLYPNAFGIQTQHTAQIGGPMGLTPQTPDPRVYYASS